MPVNHIHGKNAIFYLGANGAAAINIAEMANWSLDMDVAMADASQLNIKWKQAVKGMLGYTGTIDGNFNIASTQLWTAAISDVPENFYLYPNSNNLNAYYYGTAWVQLNKIAAGSTTAKASSGIKITGEGALSFNG